MDMFRVKTALAKQLSTFSICAKGRKSHTVEHHLHHLHITPFKKQYPTGLGTIPIGIRSENPLPVTPKGMNQPLISSYSGLNSSE
jgi:hypothetical protein